MKYRNLILSVLFWAIASVSMAVILPSEPFGSSYGNVGNDSYTLSIGSQFKNTAILSTANYENGGCVLDPSTPSDRVESDCSECCSENVFRPCMAEGGTYSSCGELAESCKQSCKATFSLPLGSSLLLLPFALVYALVRKRKENAEQA